MSLPELGTWALLPCPFHHDHLISQAVEAEARGQPAQQHGTWGSWGFRIPGLCLWPGLRSELVQETTHFGISSFLMEFLTHTSKGSLLEQVHRMIPEEKVVFSVSFW